MWLDPFWEINMWSNNGEIKYRVANKLNTIKAFIYYKIRCHDIPTTSCVCCNPSFSALCFSSQAGLCVS